MNSASLEKTAMLHAHYQDTYADLRRFLRQRERFFYWIIGTLVVALYDLFAQEGFGRVLGDVLEQKVGLQSLPDLAYLSSLLWFLLLGLVLRYCQTVVHVERLYGYLDVLERAFAQEYAAPSFTREGRFYAGTSRRFSKWAHFLYTVAFPAVLVAVLALRLGGVLGAHWPPSALGWFDLCVTLATVVTITLYLLALHGPQESPKSEPVQAEPPKGP